MTETHVNNDDPGNNAARTRLNEARSGVSATVIRSDSGRSTDLTGQTISGYRITEALNTAAGEADLYKCHKAANPGAGTYVFKIFRRENAIKESVVRKLLSERSPYVAPLEQYGIHGGRQFIVLPYYERPSLAEELRRGKRYSGQELRSVIIPSVIEGLRIIHDLGILHKDVKPANLIPDNTGKRIVLIDFGISSDTGGQTLVVTRTGMTPFYAAPEAIQGIFHKETDYYALGITIFELFTGFTPFQNAGLSEQDVMRLASLNQISFPEGFPEDLRNLVKRLFPALVREEGGRLLLSQESLARGIANVMQKETEAPFHTGEETGASFDTEEENERPGGRDEAADFAEIGRMIEGAERYFVQCFADRDTVPYSGLSAPSKEELKAFADAVRPYVLSAEIRGADL